MSPRRQRVFVDKNNGPDKHGKFRVMVGGYLEYWTLAKIKEAIANGDDVRDWNE